MPQQGPDNVVVDVIGDKREATRMRQGQISLSSTVALTNFSEVQLKTVRRLSRNGQANPSPALAHVAAISCCGG